MASWEARSGGGNETPEEALRQAQRQALGTELGIVVPPFLDEKEMPAVDEAKLEALEEQRLTAEERKRVLGCIARYCSWAEAYYRVTLKRAKQDANP